MTRIVYGIVLCLLFTTGAYSAKVDKAAVLHVEGTYQILAIEKVASYFVVRFQKYPITQDTKMVVLELSHLYSNLLHKGDLIEISAEVIEREKDLEAEEVLVHLSRDGGKTRVWLPSRKGKAVHFQGASYLEMHSSDFDYQIF